MAEVRKVGIDLKLGTDSATNWFVSAKSELEDLKPIVIHVRRGDYLLQGDDWGVLGLDYYRQALETLGAGPATPVWVFSDDLEGARELLEGKVEGQLKWVEPDQESNAAESMVLMSCAEKIVIANSTYSWWAASLGRPKKTVIAPETWFRSKPTPDLLLPPEWLRVKSF